MSKVTENDLIRWQYNCLDINYTYEISEVLDELLSLEDAKLQEFYNFQIDKVAPTLVAMMNKGIKSALAVLILVALCLDMEAGNLKKPTKAPPKPVKRPRKIRLLPN